MKPMLREIWDYLPSFLGACFTLLLITFAIINTKNRTNILYRFNQKPTQEFVTTFFLITAVTGLITGIIWLRERSK